MLKKYKVKKCVGGGRRLHKYNKVKGDISCYIGLWLEKSLELVRPMANKKADLLSKMDQHSATEELIMIY